MTSNVPEETDKKVTPVRRRLVPRATVRPALGAMRRHPLRTGTAGLVVLVVLVSAGVLWASGLDGGPPLAGGGPAANARPGLGTPAGAADAPARPSSTATRSPTPRPTPRPTPAEPPGPAGWPGQDNTGWQHTGVTLRPFHCTGDVTNITRSGTVIDGMDIRCGLLIKTNNVTISRSRVTADAQIPIRTLDGQTGIRISDVEIVGQPGCIAGIGYMGYTALRVNIHGCGDGVRIEDGSTLQDSWIHAFWDGTKDGKQIDTPHHDGAQTTGGSDITIRHDRIDNPHEQTSCILIGNEFGTPSNILIEDNYLNGGNYTIYLAPTGTNRIIRNNTFTRNHVYGPDDIAGQYVWTGNRYTDGAPVLP
ncbi:MAG TPA: right-handed parallel beta-helix repeat-containing protein [Mycobacteriales bacterium]|nr:right-handed parallel beta-helix repeat-containing protein [Mycobacteriales bacterium]